MKYCLSSRQSARVLEKADEIFVQARDYRQVSDLFILYPEKTIILEIENEKIEDDEFMNIIEEYAKISELFCCCIYNLTKGNWFKARNIKYYYGYPINNFYDLQALVELEVEYIKITAPLTFSMNQLKTYDMKFRMVPNVAYDAYIPRKDGVCGQWVRPEDIEWYEESVYVFEFEDAELDKEKTLYRIYAEQGEWLGNLNLLLTNLNVNADNRILPLEIGEIRANCEQKCMKNYNCHFCRTAFYFEETMRKNKKYLENLKQNRLEDKEEIPEE